MIEWIGGAVVGALLYGAVVRAHKMMTKCQHDYRTIAYTDAMWELTDGEKVYVHTSYARCRKCGERNVIREMGQKDIKPAAKMIAAEGLWKRDGIHPEGAITIKGRAEDWLIKHMQSIVE